MSENNGNSVENKNNKKKTYFAESQKRYGDKCKIYSVKYIPTEMKTVEIIEEATIKTGLSANAWIKFAIDEKLRRDGFID